MPLRRAGSHGKPRPRITIGTVMPRLIDQRRDEIGRLLAQDRAIADPPDAPCADNAAPAVL
jgi:hypothetical protein